MKRILACIAILCMLLTFGAYAESAAALDAMYKDAELLMVQGDYAGAASKFESMGAYSDASQMAMYCKAISAAEMLGMYEVAIDAFVDLGDFKDSRQMSNYYLGRLYEHKGDSADLETALDMQLILAKTNFDDAIEVYSELALFKDSITRIADCQAKIADIDLELANREAERTENAYQEAVAMEEAGKYAAAIAAYKELDGYKDSAARIVACQNAIDEGIYQQALALENEGKYEEAIGVYKTIKAYKDSSARITACQNAIDERIYQQALALENEGKHRAAIKVYESLNGYRDSGIRIECCTKEAFAGKWKWFGDYYTLNQMVYLHAWNSGDQYYDIDFDTMTITRRFPTFEKVRDFEIISPTIIRCKSLSGTSNYDDQRDWYFHLTDNGENLALTIDTSEFPVDEISFRRLTKEELAYWEEQERQKLLKEYTDKETIKKAQAALNEAGYDCGKPDGIAGKGTKATVTKYQTDKGLNVTGTITHELLISLGLAE